MDRIIDDCLDETKLMISDTLCKTMCQEIANKVTLEMTSQLMEHEIRLKEIIPTLLQPQIDSYMKIIWDNNKENAKTSNGATAKVKKEIPSVSVEERLLELQSPLNILNNIYNPKKDKFDKMKIYYSFKSGTTKTFNKTPVNPLYRMNFNNYGKQMSMIFHTEKPIKINDPVFAKFCGTEIKITSLSGSPDYLEEAIIIDNCGHNIDNTPNEIDIVNENIKDLDIQD